MKRRLLNIFAFVAITTTVVSCKDKAKEVNTSEAETVAVSEGASQKYAVNVAESNVAWIGSKPTGSHNGTINIETGVFNTKDGQIESGTFLIDMKSIVALDLEGTMKDNLEAHLKGTVEGKEDHFFNVEQFPTGAFEITGAKVMEDGKTVLSGNLSLKDIKHNISFAVTVTENGDMMTITSDTFSIDRTKWNINYGSKSIFDDLGDKFVNDKIELTLTLKAKKA